jgi:adenylate cyclase
LIADEFGDIRAYVNGLAAGFTLGICLSLFELHLFNPNKKRTNFIKRILLKSLVYLFVFVLVFVLLKGFIDSLFYRVGFLDYLASREFKHFLVKEDFHIIMAYIFTMLIIVIFTLQVSRKIGQGMLFNFFTGKYHEPKEERRIFMCLDLKSSTSLAEKLGDIQYHRLLNQFFFDITKCILYTDGEIYRYVGDEVVVSWNMKSGLQNANCIRTYFYAKNEINKLKEKYYLNYKLVPDFRAFFHCGVIVIGEIGEFKSQIVYHGLPLYELKEMEKKGTEWDVNLLISGELIQQLSVPAIYTMEKAGTILRPNQHFDLDAYTLMEKVL